MDVCPEPPTDIEDYINWDKPEKECVWKKQIQDEITPRYREKEALRILSMKMDNFDFQLQLI